MALNLKPRQAVDEVIESWDDDDLDIGGDDFTFRSASVATSVTNAPSHHRDSISSRLSMRSDFDSNHGDERLVHLPGNDQRSTNDAIAAATRAGIPIPKNISPSALMGGTIKRLGGRKIKQIIQQDDWNDDLELPEPGQGLKIKQQDESNFPDTLRQVSGPSSTQQSPSKPLQPAPTFNLSPRRTLKSKAGSANLGLDRFRDDDDADCFGDGGATIRVSKNRAPQPVTLIMPPTPQKNDEIPDEDFEAGLELPADGEPLRLSSRKDIPMTPVTAQDEFDEWGEGSLGTRFGGTRRDGRSNRSSSASALSPSVGSSLTAESEDEGLDGLVLPSGPLNFDGILKRRQQTLSPEHKPEENRQGKGPEGNQRAEKQPRENLSPKHATFKDDFLSGLEIGDGDVFSSSRLTMNRNIKIKSSRTKSPTRPKAAVSLTFTNKPSPPSSSRLPRPLAHDRIPSSLEPVSETGGPIQNRQRRAQSRLGGHSAQSSINSIPTPSTPSSTHSILPSTPRRHELAQKASAVGLRNEPTTTSSQLLKLKRSMPILRTSTQSPAKPPGLRYERPPSRTEGSRPPAMSRPKTPVERDRSGAESSMSHARRNPMPFLPAGGSGSQSHHITSKTSRHFRRHDSESSNQSADHRPPSRAFSRSTMRSPSPVKSRLRGTEALAREAAAKRQITKPRIPRHFGDGFELDGFDDLPTSQHVEQKFVKQPISRGAPKSLLRSKIIQNVGPDQTTTPTPTTPYSPARYDNLPRFARDTNASRMAREQALAQRAPSSGAPLTTLTNQWKAQVAAKTGLSTIPAQTIRVKKARQPVQQKPHLIKPLGDMSSNPKSMKGMVYNPVTFRWEGNENDLSPFDAPSNSPSVALMPPSMFRDKENSTPRPALITNVKSSQAVQVVGGMVFDPQAMRWLKLPNKAQPRPFHGGASITSGSDTMDGFDALDDDDDDVFKDVPDLVERPKSPSKEDSDPFNEGEKKSDSAETGLKDDWLVGEEFDVGPEFVRRQREEEERWRRKCEKWLGPERDVLDAGDWRWRIRDVVRELALD